MYIHYKWVYVPSTIHITIMFPPVAMTNIRAKTIDHESFCHHDKSNGRCWPVKRQSVNATRKSSFLDDFTKTSPRTLKSSLRFSPSRNVIFCSSTVALQLYKRSKSTPFIFIIFLLLFPLQSNCLKIFLQSHFFLFVYNYFSLMF